jgi:hypothetical protein
VKKAFVTITIIGFALLLIALPNSILAYAPSHSQRTKLSENIRSFTFEVVYESGDYFVVRVVEASNAPETKIGDVYYIGKPQMPESLRIGESLGRDERGYYMASIEPEEIIAATRYPISGTVNPGQVKAHGYHNLYTTTKVDIEVTWTPSNQVIMLGLIHWATYTFYYAFGYSGYAFLSTYPPYTGWYSIGIGNPSSNPYPIDYQGAYTIWPEE